MPNSRSIYLNQYDMLVTDREVVLDGVSRPLAEVKDVRVESTSAYRGKSIPFVMTCVFVLWALTEVLNAPPSYGWAAVAAVLAVLSFGLVRLFGDFQVHTVYLQTVTGEVAALQSRDGKAVSALVTALRKAVNRQRDDYSSKLWIPGSALHG